MQGTLVVFLSNAHDLADLNQESNQFWIVLTQNNLCLEAGRSCVQG